MQEEAREILAGLAECESLMESVSEYLTSCRSESAEQSPSKGKSGAQRFPNLAGFCRHVGAGMSELRSLRARFPHEYDRLLAIFEDEALNSALSPTLLSAYMKKRLLYSEEESEATGKEVVWCFEHDIIADGE